MSLKTLLYKIVFLYKKYINIFNSLFFAWSSGSINKFLCEPLTALFTHIFLPSNSFTHFVCVFFDVVVVVVAYAAGASLLI